MAEHGKNVKDLVLVGVLAAFLTLMLTYIPLLGKPSVEAVQVMVDRETTPLMEILREIRSDISFIKGIIAKYHGEFR